MNEKKIIENFRNERAIELFGRTESALLISERQKLDEYINDYLNPKWKDVIINDINTGYKISNTGWLQTPNNYVNRYIKSSSNDYVYSSIVLNKRQYHRMIHRLVAENFIPNPENKSEVNHINGRKNCNWVGNLEWNTRSENAEHAADTGLMLKGSDQPISKYTEKQARNVCSLAEKGYGHRYISKKLNVSDSFVVGILYRNEWRHVSKDYNMPIHKKFADVSTIEMICKMLSKSCSNIDIANKLGVSVQLVDTVKQGRAWRRISNKYNIPGLKKDFSVNDNRKSDLIRDALSKGISDTNQILEYTKLTPDVSNKKYIARIRRNYKSVEKSETIENTSKDGSE